MSTSFIRFLDELEHYTAILFLKNGKIEGSPLKNQADSQPTHKSSKQPINPKTPCPTFLTPFLMSISTPE